MACIRKRRGHWCLDYRDQQGMRHWETTKGNRKEAERLLAERVREISRGTYRAPAERVSFEGLAQAFLKDAEPNVRETTFKDYRGNLNRHLTPWFQGWNLLNIRRADVEDFRAHLCDGGIGPRTVNKCLTLLGALFRYAMRHEWIEANPAEGTKLRASSRRSHDLVEANIFAPPEIQALLAATDPRWRVVILTAMLTGLREGELLGLAWGDIDWSARQIYVRQQYTGGRFSELKTKASRRRVDLPGELVAELRRWRLECPPGAHDLVFPNGAGNPENYANLLHRGFYPALRRAGLRKIRFHDLRHTYASLLIANGEHPKRIQALMGHSSINVTMDVYGHLMPGGGGEVADRLGALVFRPSGSRTVAVDEPELAGEGQDDAQVIVSNGGPGRTRTYDQGL
jgi:integrase